MDVQVLMYFGIALFAMLLTEVLLGFRVIKIKGKLHWRVHKGLGVAALVAAALHGALAVSIFWVPR